MSKDRGPIKPNLKSVADAIDNAVDVTRQKPQQQLPMVTTDLDPEPGDDNAQGVGAGRWTPNRLGLPDDCPVKPLGFDGSTYWLLDTAGQLRAIQDREFSKLTVTSLFMGRYHYLFWGWPRFNKEGKCTSFANDAVAAALMAACSAKGPWNDVERVRGRGAWLGSKGQLIIHTGTELFIDGRELPTGELGRYVYPVRPPIPKPWHQRIDEEINPAKELYPLFRRWKWARPDVDPVLLLGWIGSAMIGGALKTRPIIYMTGGFGTGKSTLQGIIKGLFGDGMMHTTNTSAAGIYQPMKRDSIPVSCDEFEASAKNERAKSVIELARQAFSGGTTNRGGSEHKGTTFASYNAFVFSSINSPPLEPQDVSRMAFLRLQRVDPDGAPLPEFTEDELADLGAMVLRRMMDQFHRYRATFEAYSIELRAAGHDGRGCDTYGTLLTCADLLVGQSFAELDIPFGEDLSYWRDVMRADQMAEFEDRVDNWRACLSTLLTTPVEAWRGGARPTVGRVLEAFITGKDTDGGDSQLTYGQARSVLEQAGLGLLKPTAPGEGYWLAVPNQQPSLYRLFQGSKWQGEPGTGVWAGALQQGPMGTLWDKRSARISGDKCRCTVISLNALYGEGGIMVLEKPISKYS